MLATFSVFRFAVVTVQVAAAVFRCCCYCFGYPLSYTTHSDCEPFPSSAEACDIRAGDNLRSLSNNVLLSHVASSTIALRVVEIDLHEPYARMVASDLGECVEVFVSSGPFIDFLSDSY